MKAYCARRWSTENRLAPIDVSALSNWEQGGIILFQKLSRLVAEVLEIPESELGDEMKARAHCQAGAILAFVFLPLLGMP
jgi:hypothetical protein